MAIWRRGAGWVFVTLATSASCSSAGGGGAGSPASGGGSSGQAGATGSGGSVASTPGAAGSGAGQSGDGGSVADAGEPTPACASAVFEVEAGQGAAVMASNWSNARLAVRASCGENPLAGVAVNWSVSEGDGGLGESTETPVSKTYQSTTGADGVAEAIFRQPSSMSQPLQSNQPGSVHVESALGSVDFVVTVFSPGTSYPTPPFVHILVPENGGNWSNVGSGKAGTILYGAIEVSVVNATGWSSGQPVPNIGFWIDQPSVPGLYCVGPAHTVLSGTDGTATCDLQLPAQPGEVSFTLMAGGSQWFQGLKVEVTP